MHCRSEETYDETRVETGGQAGWNMMSTWAYEHIEHVWAYEDMSLWAHEHMSIWAHEQCSLSILSIWVYWAYEHIDPMSIRAYEHMSRATYDETRQVEQPATQGRRGAESCCRPSEQQQQKRQQQKQSATRLSPGQAESHMDGKGNLYFHWAALTFLRIAHFCALIETGGKLQNWKKATVSELKTLSTSHCLTLVGSAGGQS